MRVVACMVWLACLASPAAAAEPVRSPDGDTPFDRPIKWMVVEPAQPATAEPTTPEQALTAVDGPAEGSHMPSAAAMQVMTWIASSGDNNAMPYMVIDKSAAEVFVFDGASRLVAVTAALVGMKQGDESTPGVGDRELSNIPPEERTTPAGRFLAKIGRATGHRDVLWVDYATAISLHAVINVRNQHRLERLKSPTPDDNRITYGCINVPADFYARVVKPLFKNVSGVVYILPETRPANEVFLAMPIPQR